MSGGVDSSVVAAKLHAEGYDVVGITLQLYDHGAAVGKKGACCAGADIHDARRVADGLGIPHYVLNYESRFKEAVMEDFVETYLAGSTPVPCIRCNQSVKFHDLLSTARDLGADCMATGHYVQRVVNDGRAELHRAADADKDQSYFLFATTQEQLDFLRFPLGGLRKEETRALAAQYWAAGRRQAGFAGHLLRAGGWLRQGHREIAAGSGGAGADRAPRRGGCSARIRASCITRSASARACRAARAMRSTCWRSMRTVAASSSVRARRWRSAISPSAK